MPKVEIMPESKEEAEKRVLRELEGKNIAHYSVLLSSWIQTKMERDKTLMQGNDYCNHRYIITG